MPNLIKFSLSAGMNRYIRRLSRKEILLAWFCLFQQNIIQGHKPIHPQNLLIILSKWPPGTYFRPTDSWSRICVYPILAVPGMINLGPLLPGSAMSLCFSLLLGLIFAILSWLLDSPSAYIHSFSLWSVLILVPSFTYDPADTCPSSPTSSYDGLWLHHSGHKIHKLLCDWQ